jgi:LPS-assembly lipoprotein
LLLTGIKRRERSDVESAERDLMMNCQRYRVGTFGLLLAINGTLSGCGNGGFRPLYGPTPSGVAVQERMKELEVATIPGRVGQVIRNELIFHAGGGGELLPPTHRLEVVTSESVQTTLVSSTGNSNGGVYLLQAKFKLIRIKDKKVVMEGTSLGRAAFESFTNIATTGTLSPNYTYSTVRAHDDAENRAARVVADDLKTRMAIYFSGAD